MAVRKIIRMGHPLLRKKARPLTDAEIRHAETRRLVKDMVDTLDDYGGIGLAAPQIGESIRLAIVRMEGGPSRYGEIPALPLTVFVNPTITVLESTSAGYWEGCLSVPGLRGYVERPQRVRVDYVDLDRNKQTLELNGFPATVFQHEFDHLDGKLYIDRITDLSRLVFEEEYLRYAQSKDEGEGEL